MSSKTVILTSSNGDKIEAIDNTGDQNIIITKTKAKYIYQKMIIAPKKESIWSWSSLAITCFIAVVTTDPRDILEIDNSGIFVKHLFLISFIASSLACVRAIWKYFSTKDQYNEDAFIAMLMDDDNSLNTKQIRV